MRAPSGLIARLGSALLVAWSASACVLPVTASGTVQSQGDLVMLVASNGNALPLSTSGAGADVRRVPGAIVVVDGTYRHKMIEVASWRPIEGPLGFTAWIGMVSTSPAGFVLRERDGGTLGLAGPDADMLEDLVGRRVLVEGVVNGTMRIDVLAVHPLDGPPELR